MMSKFSILVTIAAFLPCLVSSAGECWNVATSEGPRDLRHTQVACSALQTGETEADKGKRYVTCANGIVYEGSCSFGLRFDVLSSSCTWPEAASCRLEDPSTGGPATADSTNTLQTRTEVETTQSGNSASTRPPVTRPSGPCNSETCRLPNCFCYGAKPNIPPPDTPQFVMLTFDDAVTAQLYNEFFRPLLIDNTYNISNPSGCGVRSAFYVNHDYTDYSIVKTLAENGNEIASHTISHSLPSGESSADYPQIVAEIVGMRDKVFEGTGNKNISDSVVGFRAPYLRSAHDLQFQALRDNHFLYDTSVTNTNIFAGGKPVWPYTLDYVVPQCTNQPCPTKPFPGLWEVPLNGPMGSNGYSCSMIDVCSVGSNVFTANEDEWYTFYSSNFKDYFNPEKVPMQLFTHGSMFLRSPPSYPALVRWFRDLQNYGNVWFVSPKMVIEWMQNPLTNLQMIAQKWGC